MPEVAQATITVTPVLEGAQQKLTSDLTGAANAAGDQAGKQSGSTFAGSFTKSLIGGTVAVTTAVVGAGAAMVGAAGKTAEYGDQIDKASQKLGVSSTFYQEWDAVLQHSGTSMDSMTGTFKKLATASQDASEDQVKAFNALGLSMDQVKNMSTEELFASVVTGLQGMEEGTERTTLATELLGKGAMEMGALFNTSAEDTQAMIDRVNELGGVMSEDGVKASAAYQDSLQDMKTAFSGVANGLLIDLLPPLTEFMNKMADFIANTDLSPVTDTIGKAVSALGDFIAGLDIEEAGKIFGFVVEGIGEAVELVWGVISTVFDSLKKGLETITSALETTGTDWSSVWGIISDAVSIAAEMIGSTIELIAQGIAALVTAAQEDGTYINAVWDSIQIAVSAAADIIQGVLDAVTAILNGDWSAAWEAAKGIVETCMSAVTSLCQEKWEFIKTTAQTVWEGIKTAITGPVETIKQVVTTAWEALSSKATEVFDAVYNKVTEVFNGIKSYIQPIVDWLKGIFNFSWKLPNISLPHFNWHWESLGGILSIPVFDGIDWYAKGGIFDDASIVGVGEAGREAVIPLEGAAMRPFAQAIAEEMANHGGDIEGAQITINVYPSNGMDVVQLANKVSDVLALQMRQTRSTWSAV